MATIEAKEVFVSAEAFLHACAVMDKTRKQNKGVTFAVMATLEAFTVELHLKCLLLLENGLQKRGHDLLKLFKFLSPETRSELTKAFDEYTAKWPSFIDEAKRNSWPFDLEGLLVRGRHAFEDFRYAHERHNSVWGLKGLILIIRDRVLKQRPEWEGASLSTYFESLNPHSTAIKKQR